MTQTEALKLALEALGVATTPLAKDRQEVLRAIAAIKEALAQPEQRSVSKQQEPVAHIPLKALELIKSPTLVLTNVPLYGYSAEGTVPVYAAPPQRTWVGLTDEEAHELWESTDSDDDWELMKRTEAKLKEKNT